MRRVSVVGNSGTGKTRMGRALADRLGVPFLELDSVYHQPGWVPLPDEEFRARVAAFVAGDGWVVDGNYTRVRDLVWARADTVVWMDPPRWLALAQLGRRTLRRVVRREELWNTNREVWTNLLRWDPERSILRWAWTRHRQVRDRYAALAADPEPAGLTFVRVRSRSAARELLDGVAMVDN